MRLLKPSPKGGLNLISFDDDKVPSYAILSHTWNDGEEVTYDELLAGRGIDKAGYAKIRFCAERALQDGLQYFWVDTCCINKSNLQELQTAVNLMYRYYQRASKCYVYLSDIRIPDKILDVEAEASRTIRAEAARQCRWFTRGWTLQELLAPPTVEFFSREGKRLGSRTSLEQEIHEITKIPIEVLRGKSLSEVSIEERMSWAATRTTTFKEDKVYCLLGIFGVFLPLNYGEGEEYAASRLKEEIQKRQEGRRVGSLKSLAVSSPLPFPRNEMFIGREDKIQSLEKVFLPNTHQRITIYGLGGCGKSALALELAYRMLARFPGYMVFWVPAIDQESFKLAYREIGIRLRIPGITEDNADIERLVKSVLNSGSIGSWLMIVDNADDPGVLMGGAGGEGDPRSARLFDCLPSSNGGNIIFTTRSRKAAEDLSQSSVLELADMDKTEARQLLTRQITKQVSLDEAKAIDELLNLLTNLPLAIVQAAAFINKNGITVSAYVSLFQQVGACAELFGEYFEDPSRYKEMDSTIARTWHISFNQIRQQDKLAIDLLSFMACIDHINISQSLLPLHGSLVQQTRAIGTLKAYAFITECQRATQELESETTFGMHRLVHMALKWWLDGHEERIVWIAKAVARLEDLIPYGGHKGREAWTSYLPHAIHLANRSDNSLDKTARASLLDRVGRCQASLGQYSAAEKTHRQALSLREHTLGKENNQTLTSLNEIAVALDKQGKYKEAEFIYRQTLEQYLQMLGAVHPDTLTSKSNLARVLDSQGRYQEAESIHTQALVQYERVLGVKHPATLTCLSNLGGVLGRQGKYTEAELTTRKALVQYERGYGVEHPDTLICMSNLALILSSQGRYEEAESINKRTKARRESVLGVEHPDTLTSMSNLALVLDSQGKYEEAELIIRETLARRIKVLEAEHPDILTSRSNLALVLDSQGKHEEAELINRETLALYERVLGAGHPYTLTSMSNLALLLGRQGKHDAESLSRQTLARREKVLGAEHPDTLMSMSNLALILGCRGNHKEAESLHRQTLARREKVLGADHPSTLTSLYCLADVLASQHRFDEATTLYERASAGLNIALGKGHPTTILCQQHYAQMRSSQTPGTPNIPLQRGKGSGLLRRFTKLGLRDTKTV